MRKYIFLHLLTFGIAFIGAIEWDDNNWASGCDFNSSNIAQVKLDFEKCRNRCNQTKECTHFSWENSKCHLKSGPIKKDDAFETSNNHIKCGIIVKEFQGRLLILLSFEFEKKDRKLRLVY